MGSIPIQYSLWKGLPRTKTDGRCFKYNLLVILRESMQDESATGDGNNHEVVTKTEF